MDGGYFEILLTNEVTTTAMH